MKMFENANSRGNVIQIRTAPNSPFD